MANETKWQMIIIIIITTTTTTTTTTIIIIIIIIMTIFIAPYPKALRCFTFKVKS